MESYEPMQIEGGESLVGRQVLMTTHRPNQKENNIFGMKGIIKRYQPHLQTYIISVDGYYTRHIRSEFVLLDDVSPIVQFLRSMQWTR